MASGHHSYILIKATYQDVEEEEEEKKKKGEDE